MTDILKVVNRLCSDNKSNSCFWSHFLSSHFALRSYQFYTFVTLIKTGVLPLQNCGKPSSSIFSCVLDFFPWFQTVKPIFLFVHFSKQISRSCYICLKGINRLILKDLLSRRILILLNWILLSPTVYVFFSRVDGPFITNKTQLGSYCDF